MQMYKQIINPGFNSEAAEYIMANGFIDATEAGDGRITFLSNDLSIIIKNDRVDFVQYFDGDDDRLPDMKKFATYQGISSLGLFEWMLLLHISKVIPIKNFVKALKKEQPELTGAQMINDIFKHFQVSALPTSY